MDPNATPSASVPLFSIASEFTADKEFILIFFKWDVVKLAVVTKLSVIDVFVFSVRL